MVIQKTSRLVRHSLPKDTPKGTWVGVLGYVYEVSFSINRPITVLPQSRQRNQ
jgi:hypothetical protein